MNSDEINRLIRIEAAAIAYCRCIDEIATSGEPPDEHMDRLNILEYALRMALDRPELDRRNPDIPAAPITDALQH